MRFDYSFLMIQMHKTFQFFQYYGFKQGPQIQKWIDSMYATSFQEVTLLNYGQTKKYESGIDQIPSVFQRAFKDKYRPFDLVFLKVDVISRTVYFKWTNNTLHAVDKSRRINIPFQSYTVFDQNYRAIKKVHTHCPPGINITIPERWVLSQRGVYRSGHQYMNGGDKDDFVNPPQFQKVNQEQEQER